MRTIFYFIFLSFIGTSVFSQQKTIVSGKINNPKTKEITVEYMDHHKMDSKIEKTKLEKDNSFYLEFQLLNPVDAYFSNGEVTQMAICPGDSLYITIDANYFDETVCYSGKGSVKNIYLAQHFLLFKDSDSTKKIEKPDRFDLPPCEFLSHVKKISKKELEHLKEFFSKHPGNEEFVKQRTKDILYNSYDLLIFHFLENNGNKGLTMLPPEYQCIINCLDSLDLKNTPEVISLDYKRLISNYIYFFKNYTFNNPEMPWQEKCFFLAKQYLSEANLDYFMYSHMLEYLKAGTVDQMKNLYDDFLNTCKNQDYIISISDIYNKYLDHAKNPKLPENAVVYQQNDKKTKGLTLEKLVEQHKGKVVYIDFWASGLSPCIQMMEPAATLHEKYKYKDIVFIYCSTDRDERAWLASISAKKLEGIHYRINTDTDEAFYKQFQIKGIPHFALIGKDGKVQFIEAKRPIDPEVEDQFNLLLSK